MLVNVQVGLRCHLVDVIKGRHSGVTGTFQKRVWGEEGGVEEGKRRFGRRRGGLGWGW